MADFDLDEFMRLAGIVREKKAVLLEAESKVQAAQKAQQQARYDELKAWGEFNDYFRRFIDIDPLDGWRS